MFQAFLICFSIYLIICFLFYVGIFRYTPEYIQQQLKLSYEEYIYFIYRSTKQQIPGFYWNWERNRLLFGVNSVKFERALNNTIPPGGFWFHADWKLLSIQRRCSKLQKRIDRWAYAARQQSLPYKYQDYVTAKWFDTLPEI